MEYDLLTRWPVAPQQPGGGEVDRPDAVNLEVGRPIRASWVYLARAS